MEAGVFSVLVCNALLHSDLFFASEKIPTKIPTKMLRWGVRVGSFFGAAARVGGAIIGFYDWLGFRDQYAREANFLHCRKLRRGLISAIGGVCQTRGSRLQV